MKEKRAMKKYIGLITLFFIVLFSFLIIFSFKGAKDDNQLNSFETEKVSTFSEEDTIPPEAKVVSDRQVDELTDATSIGIELTLEEEINDDYNSTVSIVDENGSEDSLEIIFRDDIPSSESESGIKYYYQIINLERCQEISGFSIYWKNANPVQGYGVKETYIAKPLSLESNSFSYDGYSVNNENENDFSITYKYSVEDFEKYEYLNKDEFEFKSAKDEDVPGIVLTASNLVNEELAEVIFENAYAGIDYDNGILNVNVGGLYKGATYKVESIVVKDDETDGKISDELHELVLPESTIDEVVAPINPFDFSKLIINSDDIVMDNDNYLDNELSLSISNLTFGGNYEKLDKEKFNGLIDNNGNVWNFDHDSLVSNEPSSGDYGSITYDLVKFNVIVPSSFEIGTDVQFTGVEYDNKKTNSLTNPPKTFSTFKEFNYEEDVIYDETNGTNIDSIKSMDDQLIVKLGVKDEDRINYYDKTLETEVIDFRTITINNITYNLEKSNLRTANSYVVEGFIPQENTEYQIQNINGVDFSKPIIGEVHFHNPSSFDWKWIIIILLILSIIGVSLYLFIPKAWKIEGEVELEGQEVKVFLNKKGKKNFDSINNATLSLAAGKHEYSANLNGNGISITIEDLSDLEVNTPVLNNLVFNDPSNPKKKVKLKGEIDIRKLDLNGMTPSITSSNSKDLEKKYNKALKTIQDLKKQSSSNSTLSSGNSTDKYATASLAKSLLPAIDMFEQNVNIKGASDETQKWLKGFEMILKSFEIALNESKITEISTKLGDEFDSNIHNAIEGKPSKKYKSGQIIEIKQKGYMLHDRMLRPTGVVVAVNPEEE